jgi:hypothetical protein
MRNRTAVAALSGSHVASGELMRFTSIILAVAALAGPVAAQPLTIDPAPDPVPVPVPVPVPDQVVDPAPTSIAAPDDSLVNRRSVVLDDDIAIDPPPEPAPSPPPPPEPPRSSLIVIGSALTARMPEGAGQLSDLGRGAALSIGWLQRRGDLPTGMMVRGMAVGSDGTRVYSLDVQIVASAKIGRRWFVPFVGIGLAFGSARFATTEKQMATSGMALGPVGGLGLHGFIGDSLYWRAELSAIGAGAAIVLGGVSVGWVFDS